MPQSHYENPINISLNKHGKGPFCKFQILYQNEPSGVYIFTMDDKIQYVGECEKFSARLNTGYGNISPRNCFEGGQETNCRINNLVYRAAATGDTILLWFFHTADHKKVEAELRRTLACISHSRWLIVGEMARCAVSESCAVVDTKGEYRRAHRDSVERVIIFDASARISG